jgi:surfactin synthase thioesterase subunit
MKDVMTSGTASTRSPWFLRPPESGHAARIFCFPRSGTGASAFSAWPAAIGGAQVCPVQFPGRENRLAEPHYGTYEELADSLVEPLAPLLDRPFAFVGHCAGAIPAYETVLRLAERSLPRPSCLVVCGQPAPRHVGSDRMLAMGEAELRGELEAVVRSRGIEPRPDMIDLGMLTLRGDVAAARAYRRDRPAPVDCPVVVLHWRDDPDVRPEHLREWRRYADQVEIRVLEGGQDFANPPQELSEVLAGWL